MLVMKLKQKKHLLIMKSLNKMKQLMKNQKKPFLNQKRKQKHYQELKKQVELVECEQRSKKMTLKSLRHSHPKNCKGAKTEMLPVNPQKNIRKIKPEVKEEIKNEIKREAIKETIKKPTATELLSQHYEELKQKKKQDKQEK